MADSGTYTPETIARRLKMAEALLGPNKKPITHWAEGLNELAQGYVGGQLYRSAEQSEKDNATAQTDALKGLLGGDTSSSASATVAAPASTGDGSLPRGLRNNNPLNIEAGDFTQSQPGFAGSDGRFARFDSPAAGISAANKLLDTYQRKYGLNTVAGIVNRWAPAADGNNVSAYAQNVAGRLGIDPNAPIPPEMRPQLIAAMAQHENGRPLPPSYAAVDDFKRPVVANKTVGNGGDYPAIDDIQRPPISPVAQALAQPPQQVAQAQPTAGLPAGGGNTRAAIVQMLNSSNPAVQKMGRNLATGIIQKQFTEDVPTNDMKEYQAAVRQGFNGTLLDYQTKLKEAGKPVTNINQQQESEYEKATGKQLADANMEIIKSAGNARGKIATLNRLDQLLKDPGIYTGAGGQGILELKRLGKAIGVDVGDVGPAEAAKSISSQFALELRNPSGGAGMPGAMSDKDREFLQSMVPGLGQNPQGNALIIDYMKRVAQRSVDVERLRQAYVRKNGRLKEGFYNELADWSDAHPLFTEEDMKKAAVPAPGAGGGASIDDLLRKYGGK